jgi:hypothetical protein
MPGGRPTKLDPQTLERVKSALRTGAPKETAAAFAGINRDTLHAWLQRGTDALRKANWNPHRVPAKDRPFAEFSDAVEKAMAGAEVDLLTSIAIAGRPRKRKVVVTVGKGKSRRQEVVEVEEDGQWQASAWLLERTRQGTYARRHHHQVEGVEGGAPIVVEKVDIRSIRPEAEPEAPPAGEAEQE